jgi:hypothetical protein
MSRAVEHYSHLRDAVLRPGFWLLRYHLRAPTVPAMIAWCDWEPGDPENRMDRGYFAAAIAGVACDPYQVIACTDRREISRRLYRHLVAERHWAEEWKPDDAAAVHPRRRADLTKLEPIF